MEDVLPNCHNAYNSLDNNASSDLPRRQSGRVILRSRRLFTTEQYRVYHGSRKESLLSYNYNHKHSVDDNSTRNMSRWKQGRRSMPVECMPSTDQYGMYDSQRLESMLPNRHNNYNSLDNNASRNLPRR
uniref:Expressed conserved protein n=2 Tax=Bursaphelenchus xylophilus TaxID=6326 RepID=A0A1I7SPL1_BURXY